MESEYSFFTPDESPVEADNLEGMTLVHESDKGFCRIYTALLHGRRVMVKTLMLRWSDCKMLVIRKREHPARFEVLRSENVKLKPSDQADITGLAIGMPFKATYCMRGNSIMGTYTGARHSGLDSIVPIKCE